LAEASDAGTIPELQHKHAGLELLVIEDVHALERRLETQRQLVSVLDQALDAGGDALFTCRKAPGELDGVLPRLVNRCHGGVVASVSPPDRESRAKLLGHFSRTRQIPLSADVIELLADELPVSPRELLATLTRLEATARVDGAAKLDAAFVQRCLGSETKPRAVTVAQIVRAVAGQFGISATQLRSRSRQHSVVTARHCAMLLARDLTGEPLVKIARYFGHAHHSVVTHACNRINQILPDEPALRQRLTQLRGALCR
jgi:chromosomal replication initiator protein